MTFDRALLPEPVEYFERQGLRLVGVGKWRTAACQFHGGSDSLRINTDTGGWCCMACGAKGGDVLGYHQQVHGLEFLAAARELGALRDEESPFEGASRGMPAQARERAQDTPQHLRLSGWGCDLWKATVGLAGTIGDQYLLARCCALPPPDGHLRFHSELEHPSGHTGPALVGLITDAVSGEPISLHRTWINADGSKADVDPPRLLLAGHRKQGGVIRLWPDEAVGYGLGIAEGIETALTLATVVKPVWSMIDAGNLGALPALPGIEVLTISADNDAAGLKGANACAERWTEAGCDVRLVVPPTQGQDLNDLARLGSCP